MQEEMTSRERIMAALAGQDVDRTPFGLWRHFPGEDETPDDLTNATARFHYLVKPDLVKLMPTGMYSVVPYGVQIEPTGDASGTTRFVAGPIDHPADWRSLPEASRSSGVLRDQIETVGRVRKALGDDVPIIQTIFGPLTMANKTCGTVDTLRRHLEDDPTCVTAALDQFASDVTAFGRACIDAGADGFFFATQLGNRSSLGEELYRRYGVPYDLKVLEALRPDTTFTMLHLHGAEPMFDLADAYPVDAVNWHDRETPPSLGEALAQTDRCLVGGIERAGVIAHGTAEQVTSEVREAIEQTSGRRTIIGPGCVIPCTAPVDNLHAVREVVAG